MYQSLLWQSLRHDACARWSQCTRRYHPCPSASPTPGRLRHEPALVLRARCYATKTELRPYQEECIQSVLTYLSNGEKRLGVSLATGSGKTVIFSHLIDRVPEPTSTASRTLILAHRRELVEQAANHCRNLYPDKIVEIEMGKSHASGAADITVASVATLNNAARLDKFNPTCFKLLLVDEAHHIVASTYRKVLQHFDLDTKGAVSHTALVGVSATFSRADGLALGKAVDHIVYHKDYVEMIHEGWLSNAAFTTVQTGIDLSKVAASAGDFQTGALSKAVNSDETNALTVRIWLEKAKERRSTLVFCVDIAHVNSMTDMFRRYGVDARSVTGSTPLPDRTGLLDEFRTGRFPVLVNCGIFTEGTDIPNIDCIILARPTKSRSLLMQMIGRGLRLFQGKADCHVIDLVAGLKRGVVTTPTLFGLDPDELVEQLNVEQMTCLRERHTLLEKEKPKAGLSQTLSEAMSDSIDGHDIAFTDYQDVDDFLRQTTKSHIRQDSRLSWVRVNEHKYVLSNRDGSHLVIQGDEDGTDNLEFNIKYYRRLPVELGSRTPYAKPKLLGKSVSLEAAVNAADTFAQAKFDKHYTSLRADWRGRSASESQVNLLNKLRGQQKPLRHGEITKGTATDFITRLKHGAKGMYNRIQSQKNKAAQEAEKDKDWRERQSRSEIRVGPI